jgi:hypothetical protein
MLTKDLQDTSSRKMQQHIAAAAAQTMQKQGL